MPSREFRLRDEFVQILKSISFELFGHGHYSVRSTIRTSPRRRSHPCTFRSNSNSFSIIHNPTRLYMTLGLLRTIPHSLCTLTEKRPLGGEARTHAMEGSRRRGRVSQRATSRLSSARRCPVHHLCDGGFSVECSLALPRDAVQCRSVLPIHYQMSKRGGNFARHVTSNCREAATPCSLQLSVNHWCGLGLILHVASGILRIDPSEDLFLAGHFAIGRNTRGVTPPVNHGL